MTPMPPLLMLATRAFEKLAAMRHAALLRTKQPPQPINIRGTPLSEATIQGAPPDAPTPKLIGEKPNDRQR